jgi:uncharacterized protein (TIGR02246 family)
MEQQNRTPAQLALGWRDALLARDAAAFAQLFAPEGVMVDVEHRTADLTEARPLEGRREIEATARAWLEQTPAFDYKVLAILADSDRAAIRWRYSLPTPEFELEGQTWLTCEAGEIVEARVDFDSFQLLRHLGLA